ncbi:hypothetical protein BZG36_03506 [Bifiguratus adelaidae]|uniref:Uncharacterized protein n=1 Tax=Bifiguratus adelaidae TaxID=1938954 RepID=A0A261XZD9_9FUNG|nr:hypothetical protein BZG36_03506 [Bifiguratus adelaidae]
MTAVLPSAAGRQHTIETQHEDMIHDAQLDYFARRLATASSDKSIKIFDVDGDQHRLVETLRGHEGPVWQVAWAHPKFGNILASCSYDNRVFIWKEQNGVWSKIKEYTGHTASVNSVAWAPHEVGPILACASSDGKVSVLNYKDDGNWRSNLIDAHAIGCNAVSWAPATIAGSLIGAGNVDANRIKRFASAGCDNTAKIWKYIEETSTWEQESVLDGHSDWVRDVAWAPNIGLPKNYIATCSQDKSVLIWTQEGPQAEWIKKPLTAEKFADVVWRVSWSLSGNILAVSCGDNKITLWKETLKGDWTCISEVEDSA